MPFWGYYPASRFRLTDNTPTDKAFSCLLSSKSHKTSNYLECNKWFNSYGLEKELELKFSLGSELAPLEYRKHSTCMHKLVLIAYVSKMYLLYLIMVVLEDPSWS